jgi:DNA helicase HerA-like ATPase
VTSPGIPAPGPQADLESPDGRQLLLRIAGEVPAAGELIDVTTADGSLVGYVEHVGEAAADSTRIVTARVVSTDGVTPARARQTVAVAPASPDRVAAVTGSVDPRLRLGAVVGTEGAPVELVAGRMNRHTFWCGQSGSGKTYALGVALERLLSATRLPVVVFDPNSDFVGLHRTRPEADEDEARILADRDVVVLRPDDPDHPLRVTFRALSARAQAAVLRLDPVLDRAEYHAFVSFVHRFGVGPLQSESGSIPDQLRAVGDPDSRALAERMENLGVADWRTWSWGQASVTDEIDRRRAATVLDLGQYDRHEEQLAVALAVLEHLWERRAERRPVLLVLDEAHNFCPPDPPTPLGVAVRDLLVQIAAEGRKYGLWLLLSTQRPSKIHPGVLSQCDNLTLMRMNSPADLDELARVFGFVPRQLLDRASRFVQGEALVAGGFVGLPIVVKMRDRVTPEGGVDVPVPLAD